MTTFRVRPSGPLHGRVEISGASKNAGTKQMAAALLAPGVSTLRNMPMVREQMKQQATPPLLLVMPQIRPLLARYARLFAPGLHVLSYNEIPEQREVSVIGTLG